METSAPRSPRRLTAARLGLAVLGVVLALISWRQSLALRTERQAQTASLARAGLPVDPRLARELAREPDRDSLRLRAARASLAREMGLAAGFDAGGPEGREELRQSAARLDETARHAGALLARRPASWEAAMILGAATYLSGLQARDSRVFTAHERWEEPLAAAARLAPAKREPVRFLAAAYLEIWPALTAPKRAEATRLVRALLRNPEELDRLLGPWIEATGDLRTALSALPPDPRAWERVQKILADQGDWQRFSDARGRWDRTLRAQLRNDLAEADARLAAGDPRAARALYLSILERARPELSYRDIVDAALTRCPPGPVSRQTAHTLTRLLDWAVERCLLASCALPADSLKRLARLAGDSAPSEEATAVLLAGDLPGAVALERQAETGWSDSWAPYLLVKARLLASRQQAAEAAVTLDFVPRSWWQRPTYWQARLAVSRAAGDGAAGERAAARLREMTRSSWPATDWTWRRERARLEILTGATARGLAVGLSDLPEAGAVIELRLDGALLGTFPAERSTPVLRLGLPLEPGLHLLEIESVGGGSVVPGDVQLL